MILELQIRNDDNGVYLMFIDLKLINKLNYRKHLYSSPSFFMHVLRLFIKYMNEKRLNYFSCVYGYNHFLNEHF